MFLIAALLLLTNAVSAAPDIDIGKTQRFQHAMAIKGQAFELEVPDTEKKFELGLMGRTLAPKHAMIFYFKSNRKYAVNMWMKNTIIPLDMLFLDDNNNIRCIHENRPPLSTQLISCDLKSVTVVEINAGEAHQYNMKIGDKAEIKLK